MWRLISVIRLGLQCCRSLALLPKSSVDVPVCFENIDHFKSLANVAEEKHVAAKSKAPDVRAKFRSRASHMAWEPGEMAAFMAQYADKLLPGCERAAFAGNVVQSINQILFGAVEIDQAR